MRKIALLIGSLMLALGPNQAAADDNPVLVELFTSQGCSSCPPADAMLMELAGRDDVLALSLHVDYWDYLGWRDAFAQPRFTERQKAYARAAAHRTIYTPQIIIGGRDHVVGHKPAEVAAIIQRHREAPEQVMLDAWREGGEVVIRIAPATGPVGPADVQLVRFRPHARVMIEAGENAGKTIDYANIVIRWEKIARWDGTAPFTRRVAAPGPEPVAVVVQKPRAGPVLAAARAE